MAQGLAFIFLIFLGLFITLVSPLSSLSPLSTPSTNPTAMPTTTLATSTLTVSMASSITNTGSSSQSSSPNPSLGIPSLSLSGTPSVTNVSQRLAAGGATLPPGPTLPPTASSSNLQPGSSFFTLPPSISPSPSVSPSPSLSSTTTTLPSISLSSSALPTLTRGVGTPSPSRSLPPSLSPTSTLTASISPPQSRTVLPSSYTPSSTASPSASPTSMPTILSSTPLPTPFPLAPCNPPSGVWAPSSPYATGLTSVSYFFTLTLPWCNPAALVTNALSQQYTPLGLAFTTAMASIAGVAPCNVRFSSLPSCQGGAMTLSVEVGGLTPPYYPTTLDTAFSVILYNVNFALGCGGVPSTFFLPTSPFVNFARLFAGGGVSPTLAFPFYCGSQGASGVATGSAAPPPSSLFSGTPTTPSPSSSPLAVANVGGGSAAGQSFSLDSQNTLLFSLLVSVSGVALIAGLGVWWWCKVAKKKGRGKGGDLVEGPRDDDSDTTLETTTAANDTSPSSQFQTKNPLSLLSSGLPIDSLLLKSSSRTRSPATLPHMMVDTSSARPVGPTSSFSSSTSSSTSSYVVSSSTPTANFFTSNPPTLSTLSRIPTPYSKKIHLPNFTRPLSPSSTSFASSVPPPPPRPPPAPYSAAPVTLNPQVQVVQNNPVSLLFPFPLKLLSSPSYNLQPQQ